MGLSGLVAALAVTRVGAVHVLVEEYADPVAPLADHRPVVVLAEGRDSREDDVLDLQATDLLGELLGARPLSH